VAELSRKLLWEFDEFVSIADQALEGMQAEAERTQRPDVVKVVLVARQAMDRLREDMEAMWPMEQPEATPEP
jgi:hypothetical protein